MGPLRYLVVMACSAVALWGSDSVIERYPDGDAPDVDASATLAHEVAQAMGIQNFPAAGTLHFSWTHHGSGTTRSYAWNLASNEVTVQISAATEIIQAYQSSGLSQEEEKAHKAFINDSYWLLFPFHVIWDPGIELEAMPQGPVPGFTEFGEVRRYGVRYPDDGGYTPGDYYVLYIDNDDLPVAWAYHPSGAVTPKIVTTREGRQNISGMQLPTRFRTADGELFISIGELHWTL